MLRDAFAEVCLRIFGLWGSGFRDIQDIARLLAIGIQFRSNVRVALSAIRCHAIRSEDLVVSVRYIVTLLRCLLDVTVRLARKKLCAYVCDSCC